jgi:hypothetical protein
MKMLVEFENKKEGRTLELGLAEDNLKYFLEIEPGCRVPMTVRVNDVALGLALLMIDLDLEQRIEYVKTAIAYLQPSDFDELLNRSGFRALVATGFSNATWKQVSDFCEELNKAISARTGSEFEFKDIRIDADLRMYL